MKKNAVGRPDRVLSGVKLWRERGERGGWRSRQAESFLDGTENTWALGLWDVVTQWRTGSHLTLSP